MKSVSVALVKKNDICNMFLFGSRHSFFISFNSRLKENHRQKEEEEGCSEGATRSHS